VSDPTAIQPAVRYDRVAGPTGWRALWARAVAHRYGFLVLGLALVLTGWAQATNMYGAPQRADDEGTYVAQAWAVFHWHTLAHYTYWYDHPPLGWILMGLWLAVTGGLAHAPSAVDAGRQFMLAVQLASAALVYFVARRAGMARWTSGLAVLLFSLSPLAIWYHRMVYLDNIGMLFVLLAFLLAMTRRSRLISLAGAGFFFALGVLCKETFLVLLPALGWQVWRSADRRTRAFAVSTAAAVFVLTGGMYVLYAALKGELLPGPHHVSLIGSIEWQLGQRQASGSVLSSSSAGHHTLASWFRADPWLLGVGFLCLPVALVRRSTRGLAAAFGIEALVLLRPGYLPIPFVIGMLPFAALMGAVALDTLWSWRPAFDLSALRRPAGERMRPFAGAGSTGALAVRLAGPLAALSLVAVTVVGAGPAWARADRGWFTAQQDAPYLAAQHWIEAHVPKYDRVLVDDSLWLDLVRQGYPANQVVWFYKLGTDPAVQHRFPGGWRDMQFIVSSDTMRSSVGGRAWLAQALQDATPVATWGTGARHVTILKVPGTH
jgi:hypothetical protein